MPRFRYRAARPDGTIVEDLMEGESEPAVRGELEGRGWLVFNLEGPRSGARRLGPSWLGGRLSLREFLVFNQELVALVKAGLPILKTFDLLADRVAHPAFREALRGVRAEIRGGATMSEAMARYPAQFSELYRASIRSGEHTGNLVEVLTRFIAYLKMIIGVREKVVKALAYPAFLIVVGIAVVAFLVVYVMPTFAEVYGQSRAGLPGPTRMLLWAVESLQYWLPWLTAGVVGVAALVYRWVRSEAGREQFDRLSLRLPLLGDVLLNNQLIRVARTLATTLAGGIPLLYALQITSGTTTNHVLAKALTTATEHVREGTSLAAALRQEGILPAMTLEMIEVGETTGNLETMLQDVAEFYESRLDLTLSQLTAWIEPVLLLVMGILVGGIVVIMYLPIFQIAGTV